MKSIYEMLNDVEMDAELEEQSLSELERARMKQRLRKEIKNSAGQKSRRFSGVKAAGVALLLIGVSSGAAVINPAIAQNIPVLNQVFEQVHTSLFEGTEYDRYAESVQLVAEANGITIQVDELVVDNNEIVYSYVIQGEKLSQYGDDFSSTGKEYLIDGELVQYKWGSGSGDFIDKNTYRGQETVLFDGILPEQFNLQIRFNSIDIGYEEVIGGPWVLSTQVAMHTQGDSTIFHPDASKMIEGEVKFNATVDEVIFSPIETRVNLTLEGDARMMETVIEWSLRDANGNTYTEQEYKGNGEGINDAENHKDKLRNLEQFYSFNSVEEVPEWILLVPGIGDDTDELQWLEDQAIKIELK